MNLTKLFEMIFDNSVLYHTCSMQSLKHILKYNSISSRYSYNDSGDTLNCICASRSKKFNIRTTKEDKISAQIVLDKSALNNKYKIIPFSDKNKRLMHDENGAYIQTAYEERILTSSIPNVSRYIAEINIYIIQEYLDDENVQKMIKWAKNKSRNYTFNFNFYTYRLSDLSKGSENMYDMFNIRQLKI